MAGEHGRYERQANNVIEVEYTEDQFRDLHEMHGETERAYDPTEDGPGKLRDIALGFFNRELYGDLGMAAQGLAMNAGVSNYDVYGRPIIRIPRNSNIVNVRIIINDLDEVMAEHGDQFDSVVTREDFIEKIEGWNASGMLEYKTLKQNVDV